jgi:hypothetical protein
MFMEDMVQITLAPAHVSHTSAMIAKITKSLDNCSNGATPSTESMLTPTAAPHSPVIFNSEYVDIATITVLPVFHGGQSPSRTW